MAIARRSICKNIILRAADGTGFYWLVEDQHGSTHHFTTVCDTLQNIIARNFPGAVRTLEPM